MIKTLQDPRPTPWKPLTDVSQHDRTTHSAQFYSDDRFIFETAARFLAAALARGDAAIVVATANHCEGIAAHLEKTDFDLAQARAAGIYLEMEAAQLLSRIMPQQGRLDASRFTELMGDAIARTQAAAGSSQNVSIFGEAVSVLCERREVETALQLEQLWNELARTHSFKLLCGYAACVFNQATDGELFARICAEHTHVLPEEGFLELQGRAERLRYIAQLQQKARALETETAARQHSEEALRKLEKLAAVGRITASIAHELNNPLASLTNLFYLMNTHASLDPSARHYAALADQELRRTARITKQMLAFHRESTSPAPCRIAPIIDGVLELLELYDPRLRKGSIVVEKQYKAEGAIEGFAAEMRQVFANLIGNAVEAVNGKGRIWLRVSSARDWADPGRHGVRVSVADTGPGISADDQKQIFEPFFTTKGEAGTGLGLWVCRGIVQKHGGRIRFRSRSRQEDRPGGTVFSIFLPAAQQTRAAQTCEAREAHKPKDRQDSALANGQNSLRAAG